MNNTYNSTLLCVIFWLFLHFRAPLYIYTIIITYIPFIEINLLNIIQNFDTIWCCIKLIVLNSIILNRIQQFIKVRDVSISGRREGIRYGNRKTFKDSNINNGYIKGVLLFHDLACWVCVREERAPFCLILVWFRPFIRIYRT